MKRYIASHNKVTIRLYFESKAESKMNQSMNIEKRIRGNVDNYYHYDNRGKKTK